MSESLTALVIDNGGFTCKAGFANQRESQVVFSSIVERYRRQRVMEGEDSRQTVPINESHALSGAIL